MEQFKDLVTITPWHMIMMLGNLLILTLIVKKLLFERVQKVLDERQARADAMLEDARKAKETAEAEKADYEAHLATAKQEAAALLAQGGGGLRLGGRRAAGRGAAGAGDGKGLLVLFLGFLRLL